MTMTNILPNPVPLAAIENGSWLDSATIAIEYSFDRVASPEASYNCEQGKRYSIHLSFIDYIAPFSSDGEERDYWDRMRLIAYTICDRWKIFPEDRCDFIIRIYGNQEVELLGFTKDGFFEFIK